MRTRLFLADLGITLHATMFRAEDDIKVRKQVFRWILDGYVKQTKTYYSSFSATPAMV